MAQLQQQNKLSQNDLFLYFQHLRLKNDVVLNDKKIENSKEIVEEKTTFQGVMKNVGRFFERGTMQYDKRKDSIDDELKCFENKHPDTIDDEQAKSLMDELFKDDKYGLMRLLFASTLIFDSEFNYFYVNEGLEKASEVLYDNPKELNKIKEKLEDNYNAIAPNNLSNVQKSVLFGVAAASLIGIIACPIIMAGGIGASAATTTAALAGAGFADMQLGVGMIALESIVLGAALTGITYGSMKLYNNEQVKRAFKKLSPEQEALHLALQCTFIERIKRELNDDDFKEQLDEILKESNNLKSDLDYYLFVEKTDRVNNIAKVKEFHKFDKRLMEILDLSK